VLDEDSLGREPRHRVDPLTGGGLYAKVQVGAGGVSAVADGSDHFTGVDPLADADVVLVVVAIFQQFAVICADADPDAVPGGGASGFDNAALGGVERRTNGRSKVGAVMEAAPTRAEPRGDRARGRGMRTTDLRATGAVAEGTEPEPGGVLPDLTWGHAELVPNPLDLGGVDAELLGRGLDRLDDLGMIDRDGLSGGGWRESQTKAAREGYADDGATNKPRHRRGFAGHTMAAAGQSRAAHAQTL